MDVLPALPPGECITTLLAEADRLGVDVRWKQQPESAEPSGTYTALPGKPGYVTLQAAEQQDTDPRVCRLLAHEMVHVIQHWQANFVAVLPLGWPVDKSRLPRERVSTHEAEAFTAQWQPRRVIKALNELEPQRGLATSPSIRQIDRGREASQASETTGSNTPGWW